jgi:hypothetical protein
MAATSTEFALTPSFVDPVALLLVEDCDELSYLDALTVARAAIELRLAAVGVAELQAGLREIGVRFEDGLPIAVEPDQAPFFRGRLSAVMERADTSNVPVAALKGITGLLIPFAVFDPFERPELEAAARSCEVELVWLEAQELPERKPGRNEPCPCGSGLKFKRCCGR